MRERVESLRGRFWVDMAPGQGTAVRARLALRAAEEDRDGSSGSPTE